MEVILLALVTANSSTAVKSFPLSKLLTCGNYSELQRLSDPNAAIIANRNVEGMMQSKKWEIAVVNPIDYFLQLGINLLIFAQNPFVLVHHNFAQSIEYLDGALQVISYLCFFFLVLSFICML